LILSGGGGIYVDPTDVLPERPYPEEYHHSKNRKKKIDIGSAYLRNEIKVVIDASVKRSIPFTNG